MKIYNTSIICFVFVFFINVALVFSEPTAKDFENCGINFDCAEQKLINLLDSYDSKKNLDIIEGVVTVEKTTDIEKTPNEKLFDRVRRFIDSHEIKVNLKDAETSRALNEGKSI